MRKLLLLGLIFEISICASAATPPPTQPTEVIDWKASLPKKATRGVNLGSYRIVFEQTTLAQVWHASSSGEIFHRGDAAESVYWLCYTISDRDRIWVISHGEMGGDKHLVAGISAQRNRGLLATPDCPLLPKTFMPVSLDTGVWLGSSNKKIGSAIGLASHVNGAWRSYNFESKVSGDCDGGFDLMNWLETKSRRGSVVEIFAGQVTSC